MRSIRWAPVIFVYKSNSWATSAITASFWGLTSPAAMRGTMLYNRLVVYWPDTYHWYPARSEDPDSRCSFQRPARILAIAGLQTSQPASLDGLTPVSLINPSNVVNSFALPIIKSSATVFEVCAHRIANGLACWAEFRLKYLDIKCQVIRLNLLPFT